MSSDSIGEGGDGKSSLCDLEWTPICFNRRDIHGLPKLLENQCSGEIVKSFWAVWKAHGTRRGGELREEKIIQKVLQEEI